MALNEPLFRKDCGWANTQDRKWNLETFQSTILCHLFEVEMVFFFDAVGIFLLPKSTWYSALSSRQCSSLCNQNSLSVIMSPSASSVKQAGAGLSPIYLHCAVLYCNSVHLIQSNFRAYYTVNSGMPQNFQAGGLSSNPSATHRCAKLWPIFVGLAARPSNVGVHIFWQDM